jgi:hypothetical protein
MMKCATIVLVVLGLQILKTHGLVVMYVTGGTIKPASPLVKEFMQSNQ